MEFLLGLSILDRLNFEKTESFLWIMGSESVVELGIELIPSRPFNFHLFTIPVPLSENCMRERVVTNAVTAPEDRAEASPPQDQD